MNIVTALLAGLVFGLGLIVSGMSDPAKVLGFLDLAGHWDPSLALVMGGAVGIAAVGYRLVARRRLSVSGGAIDLPNPTRIDRRLAGGALTFGVGWGLAGYCPGPVLVSLANGGLKPWLFFIAMLAGMAIFELVERVRAR